MPQNCSIELLLLEYNQGIIHDTLIAGYSSDTATVTFKVTPTKGRYYNAFAVRAKYNGPGSSSPDYLIIDSVSITSLLFQTVEVEAPKPGELYVLSLKPTGRRGPLYKGRNVNGVISWTLINDNVEAPFFRKDFIVNPRNTDIMYRGRTNGRKGLILKSMDGGQTWKWKKGTVSTFHADPRDMILFGPSADGLSDTLLIGNDGGVTYSDDGCQSYQNRNGYGLGVTQFYGFANNEQNEKNILAGA